MGSGVHKRLYIHVTVNHTLSPLLIVKGDSTMYQLLYIGRGL